MHVIVKGTASHDKLSNNRISGVKRTHLAHELVSKHTLNVETENSLFKLSHADDSSNDGVMFTHLKLNENWKISHTFSNE